MATNVHSCSNFMSTPLAPDEMVSLPRSLHEAYKLHLSKPHHPAVKMFGSSILANRSCHEAIIFLYGVSGAGKSSTINHLFGQDILPTSDRDSCTNSVTEWVSNLSSEHWQVSNLEMGFIDVPGWGDSDESDASNFALIEHFLTIHPILGSKFRKFYPNIVLLVFNSNDNRMLGLESNGQKMLRALSKLDIVDRKHPNVVIVLTHVCSYPPSEFVEKLEELSKIYQTLSRSNLGVDPPVVWLENNRSGFELKRSGDWTLLYDGTAQPLNLYVAMKYLLMNSNDEVGKEAIRLYLRDKIKSPIERLAVNSRTIDSKLSFKRKKQWLEIFSHKIRQNTSTELSKHLSDYITSHEELGMKLRHIQGLILALKASPIFFDMKSIVGKSLSYVQEQLIPYPLTVKENMLLANAFELIVPNPPDCLEALGKGYDMKEEQICSYYLFEFSESKYLDTFLNCFMTKSKTIFPCKTNRVYFETIDPQLSFIIKEFRKLEATSFDRHYNKEKFKSQLRRLLIEKREIKLDKTEEMNLLFWIECGLFMIQLSFPFCRVSKEFIDAIYSLPKVSLRDNRQIKEEYKHFFENFGNFAIVKASGGGLIEGRFKIDNVQEKSQVDYISKVQSLLYMYIDFIKEGNNWKEFREEFSKEEIHVFEKLDSAPLEWLAGDETYSSKCLDEVTQFSFETWQDSLKRSSIFFDYSYGLIPVYALADTIDAGIALQIKIAFKSLLSEVNTRIYYDEDDIHLQDLGKEFIAGKSEVIRDSVKTISRTLSRHRLSMQSDNSESNTSLTDKEDREIVSLPLITITENDKTDISKLQLTCFPPESYVILKNSTFIKMKDLEIGDHILSLDIRTHKPVYSKVYMWGHLDPDLTATFIEIHYEGGVLKLTENHLLLSGHDMSFTTAARVRRGDVVYCIEMTDTQSLRGIEVKSVNRVKLTGVYAPFTHNSMIVVDGLVCSAFAIPDFSITKFDRFEKMSRICMCPIRLLDSMGVTRIMNNPLNDSLTIHWYAQSLLHLYKSFLLEKDFC